jgi:hypothetical protein
VAIATRVFELGSEGVYDPAFEAELAYGAMAQDDLAFLLCQVCVCRKRRPGHASPLS